MSKLGAVVAAALLSTLASAFVSSTARAQAATPPMVGRWQGDAAITVSWTHQRTLKVDITIFQNDSVAGTVGDAELVGARFTKRAPGSGSALRWKSDYLIEANLGGPIIREGGIFRPSLQMALNWNDGQFTGGLATCGWRVGSAEYRTIEATFALRRTVVALESPPTPPSPKR